MAHPYPPRPASSSDMDTHRDDSRHYPERLTLPPLEYPSPSMNNSKYPPSSPVVNLPALHGQQNTNNSQHQQQQYHSYPDFDRPPHMHSEKSGFIYPPPHPPNSAGNSISSPYGFVGGNIQSTTRQVRKIGQRREGLNVYRKSSGADTLISRNRNSIGSPRQLSRQPQSEPAQNNQPGRQESRQSSPPPFGPPPPQSVMHDPYREQGNAEGNIASSNSRSNSIIGNANSIGAVLMRSPSPQSRDLKKRPSTGTLPRPKEQKLRDSSGIGIADLIRPDSSKPQPTYSLHMRQQPVAARACGFGERDRRVVDPPPILELKITPSAAASSSSEPPAPGVMSASDEMARRLRYPYYVVHCSLWDASRDADSGAMESDGTNGGAERRNQQRRLMGTLVASPFVGKDERGVEGCFFCFPDLSCRTTGRYRLRFVLMVLDPNTMRLGTKVPFSASVTSGVVTVYAAKDFPGMQASTPLTRRLKEQGCLISVKKGIEKIGERGGESDDEEGAGRSGR